MSEEQLKAFIAKVQGDTSLQEKLKAASDADGVVAIAKEAGFSISADDFKNTTAEIEDAELEAAAGGDNCPGDLLTSAGWACSTGCAGWGSGCWN